MPLARASRMPGRLAARHPFWTESVCFMPRFSYTCQPYNVIVLPKYVGFVPVGRMTISILHCVSLNQLCPSFLPQILQLSVFQRRVHYAYADATPHHYHTTLRLTAAVWFVLRTEFRGCHAYVPRHTMLPAAR